MSAERRVHPSLRKKDVAGPLDLGKPLEARAEVLLGGGRAERWMEVADRLQDPRLAAAVPDVGQAGEERVAGGRIGGECRPHELELRLAIRVLNALRLIVEDLLPVAPLAQRELQGQRDEV